MKPAIRGAMSQVKSRPGSSASSAGVRHPAVPLWRGRMFSQAGYRDSGNSMTIWVRCTVELDAAASRPTPRCVLAAGFACSTLTSQPTR